MKYLNRWFTSVSFIIQLLLIILGEYNGTNPIGPYGISHGDERYLQFNPYFGDYEGYGLNNADARVSKTTLELWKNFVKTGNPSTNGRIIFT
jgi:hypothetical protein